MTKYKISASSNLLETNKCWEPLQKTCNLNFESYGDITSSLFSDDSDGLIIVIFLEDLLQNIKGNYDEFKRNQIHYLKRIEKKAKISSKPIIICFGNNYFHSIIETAKTDTNYKKFYDWLLQELKILRDNLELVYLINLNDIFYQHGADKMFSERNWYFSRCRLSLKGMEVLSDNLNRIIARTINPAKKVLVLDCDNTIWGGVVGEEGVAGLVLGQDGLGQAFVDFQKEIVRQAEKGVIIVLSSKNNEEDVWEVFNNHDAMVLKREHITTSQINWKEKSDNIIQISNDLDLNIDSFVFWDDNPLERDKMKTLAPKVLTVEVPKNVLEWPKILRNLDSFAKFKILDEDKKKTEQYKSRAAFNNDLKKTKDLKSYLSSLNLSPVLLPLSDSNITRAEQMCLKTNQFNLSVKRYSAGDLLTMHKDPNNYIFLINFSDNYGDHGIVALVCLQSLTKDIIFLDTFLMSCRVLGRHLEAWILNQIKQYALNNGKKFIFTNFNDTGRNKIALEFLTTYGFKKQEENTFIDLSVDRPKLDLTGYGYLLSLTELEIPNLDIYTKS